MGLLRTLTCGGWTYVTSSEDHKWHDIFMISYLIITLPWMLGSIALSPPNPRAIKYRKRLAAAFFTALVPMIYYFLQHKLHKIPGGTMHPNPVRPRRKCAVLTTSAAYTIYAFWEWSLILFDVAFDAVTALDFSTFEVEVRDVKGSTTGYVPWLPA